jgi:hypothetical protein
MNDHVSSVVERVWLVARSHWLELALLVLAPIVAIVGAFNLIEHTNWMTYDNFNVRRWPAVAHGAAGTFVLHGLLFCSLCLVLLNTLAYAASGWRNQERSVLVVYGLAVGIVVFWAFEVYLGPVAGWLEAGHWDLGRHLHDLFACTLFLLFSIMDLMLYLRCRKVRLAAPAPARAGENGRLDEETYLRPLLMVDVPVVCGIIFANFFLHELLEDSPALGSSETSTGFLTGFGAGSLVMQIALSQFVFLIIYLRYFRERYRSQGPGIKGMSKAETA